MTKDEKINTLCLIIIIGITIAIVFHFLIMGIIFKQGYPRNTFLFRPDDRFNDFYNPLRGASDLDPYNPDRIYYIGGYLPFGYIVAFLFSFIRPWIISLFILLYGFIIYLGLYIGKNLYDGEAIKGAKKILRVVCIAYLTYPVLFVIDRANFDMVIFILLSVVILMYQSDSFILSVFPLSFAIAMKMYPGFFLLLYFVDRKFKELFYVLILVLFLSIGSLALLHGGFWTELQKAIVSFDRAREISFEIGRLIGFNSSLYTVLVFAISSFFPNIASNIIFNISYIFIAMSIIFIVTTMIIINDYAFWQKILLIVVMMILLFPSSSDYRLLMLYLPMMLFIQNNVKTKNDLIIVIIIGLLLVPKAYINLYSEANIGIVLNPLLLMSLMVVSLVTRSDHLPNSVKYQ